MISFKGSYISPVNIKQRDLKGNWKDKTASLIELNPHSFEDIHTMNNIEKNWNSELNLELFINHDFQSSSYYKNDLPFNFYAITAQKDKFDILEPSKILCLAEVNEEPDGMLYIDLLQTMPKYITKFTERNFKGIGTAMVKALINIAKEGLIVYPLNSAKNFYTQLNFKPYLDNGAMILKK